MYICICRAVTEAEIRAAIERGAETEDALRSQLGVSTECGKCSADVRRILSEYKRAHHRGRRRKP